MWETIAIIVTLGGLEFTLWFLDRRAAKEDQELQRRQLKILDGILTELAIQNSEDMAGSALTEANASLGLISVLAPIGIALIGRRQGVSTDAMVPGRIRRLRILQVTHGPASSSEKALPVRRPVNSGLTFAEGLVA